jgi:lipopolysaccharide/colanic/teichoic acid biosynthesis glycosyltransferase
MTLEPASVNSQVEIVRSIYCRGGKRGLDTLLAGFGVILLSPLILISVAAVFLESGWPLIFKQVRCGMSGRTFTIYKLRTMSAVKIPAISGFDAGSDARVTRVGRILRKTKLDEVLQLFNVLKGDMSIVGPRPEVPYWVSQFPSEWAIAHRVRPGLSDEAALLYINEEEELRAAKDPDQHYRDVVLPRKLSLYNEYVSSCSLQRDLLLIIRTIKAVLS